MSPTRNGVPRQSSTSDKAYNLESPKVPSPPPVCCKVPTPNISSSSVSGVSSSFQMKPLTSPKLPLFIPPTQVITKTSPFLSMFSKKKRINGTKSADNDIKVASVALFDPSTANDFIDSDKDSVINDNNYHFSRNFNNKFNSLNESTDKNNDNIDNNGQLLMNQSNLKFFKKKKQSKTSPNYRTTKDIKKSYLKTSHSFESVTSSSSSSLSPTSLSLSALSLSDPHLMEALEILADMPPPIVARSIPKHATIDTTNFVNRSLDNCLFDSSVYDGMLFDSLKAM
ncbi:unnamed protein product [Dracunculus medinensis]|uniref:Flocculation protein FLO11-like n=1 Tax=Dracunculus medinensis TaxID=318479 RepID=A0A0N4UJD4_DRAME|nr:unnamed protein product [Dracunculus medinensis]